MEQTFISPGSATVESTKPETLRQNAIDYLHKPEGQLHDTLETIDSASKIGKFNATIHHMSSSTMAALKKAGHSIQENAGGGSHTVRWDNAKQEPNNKT